MYRYSVKCLSIYTLRSQNNITFCQVKTAKHTIHWLTQRLSFGKVPIPIAKMTVSYSELVLTENNHSYVNNSDFLTLPIYYKLQKTQWIEELQWVQKIIGFFLKCELNVTVKLYRTACSLSDVDSHFFTKENNSYSCSLLNVCNIAQQ